MIEHCGLHAVDRIGEPTLRSFLRFVFLPQFSQIRPLILRKDSKKAIGGPTLSIFLVDVSGDVVCEGVSGIDLDDVVHEKSART